MLHLDSEYRKKFQLYHLATGEIADSRKVNWRQVEWEKVIQIDTKIRNNINVVFCKDKPNFKFFLNFRWAGREALGNKKYKEIRIWTVGWSDGKMCYLEDYDFKMGYKIKSYVDPLSNYKGHIHPRIINLGLLK
jgi:hypothetical protein